MATTFIDYTGDGNATKSFSFPSIQESDVKVEVDGVVKSSGTHYNITSYTTTGGGNVVFTSGNIPSSPASIRIFRDTDVDSAKATYTAGSSVKAADLNANHEQLLFAAQEEQNQTIIGSDIKDGVITSAKIKDGTIVNADVNASAAIEGSKLQASSGSNAGTMSAANFTKLAGIETGATADQTNAEIRAAVEAASDSNVFTDADHSKLNGIESGATADQTNAEIRAAVEAATDSNVFTDADHSKLNAIEAGATADQTVTEIKSLIAGSPLDASHLAANSVTTSEIADAELTTLAGMQSGTASKLADSTALTADIADLNQIDGMQKATTITDDDTKFPTSGAVVDYVAAQLEPFGGFEAIANEVSFPNTQPAAGVAISIADAAGIVVNGSGTSTTGRTLNGTTVTINNINSQYNSSTVASGIRFIVTSTGSGQVYNYHKSTLPESDLVNLSGDINDFNERYRVGGSNPTTSLDAGDLFYNTGTNQLLVYNASTSAWEETQSVGNFFINTISSSSATGGGSATPNGTAYRFTLSNAGANAEQHLVSVDGVIQKPNSGTSQPSEGFAVDGADIILGAAPVNGASFFVITIGASVGIGTPSNNTVTSAVLQNGSVIRAKIADDAIDGTKIADDAVSNEHIADNAVGSSQIANGSVDSLELADNAVISAKIADDAIISAKIASNQITNAHIATTTILRGNMANNSVGSTEILDEAVTLAKLEHGTSSNDGKFLRANNGADPTFESVITDVVGDTSPQLGGDLSVNNNNIGFGDSTGSDNNRLMIGASNDLQIYHDGTNSILDNTNASAQLRFKSDNHFFVNKDNNKAHAKFLADSRVELYHNNHKAFQTSTHGAQFFAPEGGTCQVFFYADEGDDNADLWGLQASHTSSKFSIINYNSGSYEDSIVAYGDGKVELYYDNSKKFQTSGYGADVIGALGINDTTPDFELTVHGPSPQLRLEETTTGGSKRLDLLVTDGGQATIGANQSAQSLVFQTTGSDRMHIDSGGKVGISQTEAQSSGFAERLQVLALYGGGQYGVAVKLNQSSGSLMRFATKNPTSGNHEVCGSISGNGTGSSYNTSSDYRLKENDVKISDGITRIKQLRPIRFNWKADPSQTVDGFFAHEVQPVVPESITGEKDAPIDEIGAGYQQIDHSKLVPLLTAGLQEAVAKIETLETKVAALEAA